MESVIRQFFYGEQISEKIPHSKDFQKANEEFCALEKEFVQCLTEEQDKKYSALELAFFGVEAEGEEDSFIAGFKYGMAFAIESQNR